MRLQVLLVEDDPEDLAQFCRDLPGFFESLDHPSDIYPMDSFDDGLQAARNPLTRYDLVISDTYRGDHQDQDAAVMQMIEEYRNGIFCPLIVMSSGVCPADFNATPFVRWASKDTVDDLNNQIREMLQIGIPQTARKLHNELDNIAGQFLWGFIDANWSELEASAAADDRLIERIVRRRAAIALSDLIPSEYAALDSRYGLEYYVYPALDHAYFSLGDILRHNQSDSDFRVIMTPHCHLIPQSNQPQPRADHVLTVRTVPVSEVLAQKIDNAKTNNQQQKDTKLRRWAQSPAQTGRQPAGRHWYLPKFLDIPHLYCDFLQVESLPLTQLNANYHRIATLLPPYAEALQECFSSFYGSVGIPGIDPKAIRDMIDDAP